MKRTQNNIRRQALLAALVVFLTVIILFAITAAWYTNIAQTSGLVFEAEKWGFEGEVLLSETEPIKAAPGQEGIISLTARNTGNTVAAVGINVNKAKMTDAIQQRIYFYVDAKRSFNGERVDRVYLNSDMNYVYTLFSGDSLVLGEEVYNGARLKWHWVYDVLGYYVKGTRTTEGKVVVSEYLRPIEYEYDRASTTFVTEAEAEADDSLTAGALKTIDGKMTAEEFLIELSEHDGYEGVLGENGKLNANISPLDGYYPIDVDEKGYGVWAHLCTYSEIEMNTLHDTQLGEGKIQVEGGYEATITLSAMNTDYEPTTVDSEMALLNAINSGADTIIQLSTDMVLSDKLQLFDEQQATIDLNGHTLTLPAGIYSDKKAGVQLSEGSCLNLYNGTVVGEGGTGIAFYSDGGELNLSGVTVKDVQCALYVRDDWSETGADSTIRISNSHFTTTSDEGIYLSGNGSASAQKTTLIVENSTITSGYIGIMGNGNDTQWGTDCQVINSVITGKYSGIYQPQRDSTLTISGDITSTRIDGINGLTLKGGSATILGGLIVGTGDLYVPETMPLSGFTETGDGIYIETNYGYDISLEVYGGDIRSTNAQALRVYRDTDTNVSVKVYGGTFSTAIPDAYKVQAETETVGTEEETTEDTTPGDEVTDNTETETTPGTDTEGSTDTDSGENTESGTDAESGDNAETGTDATTDTDTETDTGTEGGETNAETNTETNTETQTETTTEGGSEPAA